jgi:hypothetical protein
VERVATGADLSLLQEDAESAEDETQKFEPRGVDAASPSVSWIPDF